MGEEARELISSFGLSASLMDFYPFGLSLVWGCFASPAYVFLLLCLPLPTSCPFLPFAPSCCVNFVFVLWFFAAFVFVPSLFYYGHRHTHTFIYCACAHSFSLYLVLSLSFSSLGHLFIFVSCFRRCVVGAFININEFCSMKVKLKFTLCQQRVPFKGGTSNSRPGPPLGVLST